MFSFRASRSAAAIAVAVGVAVSWVLMAATGPANAASVSGDITATDVVVPPIPVSSNTPSELSATISYSGTQCAPCTVDFYVEGWGWANRHGDTFISNGGTAIPKASAAPQAAGRYPVTVYLYGASGYAVDHATVGTLVVGTGALTFGPLTASPTRVVQSGTTTLTSGMFIDGPSGPLPAPVGTAFVVQFKYDGGISWTSIQSGRVQSAGTASATVTPTRSGQWRLAAAGLVYTDGPVHVEWSDGALNLRIDDFVASSTAVTAGESLTLSGSVQAISYTGSVGPAPAGTPYRIEFTPVDTYGRAGESVTVHSGVLDSAGAFRVTVTPPGDGYYTAEHDEYGTPSRNIQVTTHPSAPPAPVGASTSKAPTTETYFSLVARGDTLRGRVYVDYNDSELVARTDTLWKGDRRITGWSPTQPGIYGVKTVIRWQQQIFYKEQVWKPGPDCSSSGVDGCAEGHDGAWINVSKSRPGKISTVTRWNSFRVLTDDTPWCATHDEFAKVGVGMTQAQVQHIFYGDLAHRGENLGRYNRIIRNYNACATDSDYTDFDVAYMWKNGAFRVTSKVAYYQYG